MSGFTDCMPLAHVENLGPDLNQCGHLLDWVDVFPVEVLTTRAYHPLADQFVSLPQILNAKHPILNTMDLSMSAITCRTCLTVHAKAGLKVDVEAIKEDFRSLLPMLNGASDADGCSDVYCKIKKNCRNWPPAE